MSHPHLRRILAASAASALASVALVGPTGSAAHAAAAACVPAQVVGNSGFESGAAPWTTTPSVVGSFTGQAPHAGSRLAWLNGYGSAHTDRLSQSLALPAGCTSATLKFWLHVDTAQTGGAVDTLTVQIGTTTVATFSNLDAAAGYTLRTFDLSAFAGQTVALTYTGVENAGGQTSFVVDDVTVDAGGGGAGSNPTRTPNQGKYTINLTSNATGSVWTGHESVAFTNASPVALTEVYLRLWDNFRGPCPAGQAIVVTNVSGGTVGAPEVACTALKITLPAPLAQGQRATVGFDLSITVPNVSDRFGRAGAFDFLGNALPVLAVRDGRGWHLDPYTNNGESFYQLISDYTVTLDHPTSVLVPATGTATDAAGAAGRTVTTATATNVREFAWAAGPFSRSTTTSPGGVRVNTYWTNAVSAATAASMQDTAVTAIDGHGARYGAYPYGEVDVLLHNNFPFGGMEYPGLILDLPSASVIIHELGHQWFYGIVGDDEYNDPWLDEGFTDYATDIQRGILGTNCFNNVAFASPAEKVTNSMAYWDAHANRYFTVVYGYGKCALHDLRRLLGDATMTNLLRGYAQAHRFGISTVPDFMDAAQAATTTDLTAFWAQHRIERGT